MLNEILVNIETLNGLAHDKNVDIRFLSRNEDVRQEYNQYYNQTARPMSIGDYAKILYFGEFSAQSEKETNKSVRELLSELLGTTVTGVRWDTVGDCMYIRYLDTINDNIYNELTADADNISLIRNAKFEDAYMDDETVTYYFTADRNLIGRFAPKYRTGQGYNKNIISTEISIEMPVRNRTAEYATVMMSPTDEDGSDYDWCDADTGLYPIGDLIRKAEESHILILPQNDGSEINVQTNMPIGLVSPDIVESYNVCAVITELGYKAVAVRISKFCKEDV